MVSFSGADRVVGFDSGELQYDTSIPRQGPKRVSRYRRFLVDANDTGIPGVHGTPTLQERRSDIVRALGSNNGGALKSRVDAHNM